VTRRLLAALVAVLLGTATGAVVLSAPAQAAGCAQGTGVTVVVDYQQLGGGTSARCVSGGGSKAAAAFSAAGVGLQRASRQPGFVCRVNAKPADAGCVQASPSDAYWSLWVSSGNGTWSYASTGVDGLSVPKGGWVAFSWQGQSGKAQPRVTPVGAKPAPKPAPTSAAAEPTGGSSSSPRPAASASASASAAAKAERAKERAKEKATEEMKKEARARAAASAGPSTAATTEPSDEQTQATSAASGTPWSTLVGVLAVLVLLGVAGLVAWRRRSSTS
jgi:MYXO-CTERM domain-containing protein